MSLIKESLSNPYNEEKVQLLKKKLKIVPILEISKNSLIERRNYFTPTNDTLRNFE